MERPFADKRLIGPILQLSSSQASDGGITTEPCAEILELKGGVIEEMVEKTGENQFEYASIFVKTEDGMLNTDIEQGKEEAISARTLAEMKMDATMLAINDQGGGSIGPDEYDTYHVHTHPEGHVDMSLRDISGMGDKMMADSPTNMPEANLVAVKDGDRILLHGLYRDRTLTEEEILDIKRYSSLMESDVQMYQDRKSELLDVMLENGFKQCESSMEI